MAILRTVRAGLRRLLKKDAVERDLDDEVRDYLAHATDEYIRAGMTPAAAARRARAELGSVESVKEEARGSTTWDAIVETTARDVRFGLRSLARAPGFAFTTAVTLALGIGGTSAIVSAVKPILFDPLPYPNGGAIVNIAYAGADGSRVPQTFGTYEELARRSRSFLALAPMKPWSPTIAGAVDVDKLTGQRVGAGYLKVLGVNPAIGHDLDPSQDRPGGADEVLLSDSLWRRRFDGNAAIVGSTILLDGRPFTVAGVMPPSFENVLAPEAEIWTLLKYDPALPANGREWGHHLRLSGRLSPQTSLGAAEAELRRIAQNPIPEFSRPPWASMANGLIVSSLAADVTGAVRPAFTAVLGAVLVMLAIACVNVANLLVGRSLRRRSEIALRTALGASRSRLIRQLLTEGAVIAVIGGVLGLVVAYFGLRELVAVSPPGLPRVAAMRLDGSVLAFTAGLTLLVALVVGIIPAVQLASRHISAAVRVGGFRIANAHVARHSLVIVEVALALILLVNAGLLGRSLSSLFAVNPGFDAAHVLTMQIHPPPQTIDKAAGDRFFRDALAAVRSLPRVAAAGFTTQLPFSGDDDEYGARFEGEEANTQHSVFRYAVSDGFFEALGIPLKRGRAISARDGAATPPVAVISASLAARGFADRDPIGQRIHVGPDEGPWFTVIGVAGDVRQASLATSQPDAVYIPAEQSWSPENLQSLVVRSDGEAGTLTTEVKGAVRSIASDRPIVRIATMAQLIGATAAERRFVMLVLEAFALVALALSAIGLHGVLSSQVAERMREIGVRAALGASRGAIVRLILGQGFALTLAGLGIGLAGAVLASKTLVTLLFGVTRLDVATYAGVTVLLAAVSVLACAIPAWRAAHVDPVTTLRID